MESLQFKTLRPIFDAGFAQDLQEISDLLTQNKKDDAEGKMINLVGNYGTHYGVETFFGAAYKYEQRFFSRSSTTDEERSRNTCSSDAAEVCGGAKTSNCEFFWEGFC